MTILCGRSFLDSLEEEEEKTMNVMGQDNLEATKGHQNVSLEIVGMDHEDREEDP